MTIEQNVSDKRELQRLEWLWWAVVLIWAGLVFWVALVTGYIAVLVQGNPTINVQVLQLRNVFIINQGLIGSMMVIALLIWFTGKEESGLDFAVGDFFLSLAALQTLNFYISQFSAITATLLQLAFPQIFLPNAGGIWEIEFWIKSKIMKSLRKLIVKGLICLGLLILFLVGVRLSVDVFM